MNKEQPEKKRWLDERGLRTTATPEQVWEAWANPEHIARWFADSAEGEAVAGKQLVHHFREFGSCSYKVLESEPPNYLKLEGTMLVPFVQEIRIEKDRGDTLLRLIHSGFGADAEWGEEYAGIDSGWKMALAVLKHYLENFYGRSRTSFLITEPSHFKYSEVIPFYREENRLKQWLSNGGSIGETGEPYRLQLQSGTSLTGRVLAFPPARPHGRPPRPAR